MAGLALITSESLKACKVLHGPCTEDIGRIEEAPCLGCGASKAVMQEAMGHFFFCGVAQEEAQKGGT